MNIFKNSKKAISVGINTIFYILMSMVLIWIIVFGYQKITDSTSLIDEQDRLQVVSQLENALEYCSDPLNKGSSKLITINHNEFNSICVFGSGNYPDIFDSSIKFELKNEFDLLKEGGDNVVLMKTEFINSTKKVNKAIIKDSFKVEYDGVTKCFIDKENKGKLDLVFHCD